jgi:hypothetical protein
VSPQGYGIASAATGSGSSSSSAGTRPVVGHDAAVDRTRQNPGRPAQQRTLLTGDTASKVETAAVAEGRQQRRVVRSDRRRRHAAYEVHMVKADGTPTTVYVDKQFDVVSVETR